MYRALNRLVERKWLARLGNRFEAGRGAGSGQDVYQLGSEGWKLVGRPGKYWPFRARNYHMLAIPDAYLEMLELEREGKLTIETYSTEPESHRMFGEVTLRPDLDIVVSHPFKDSLRPLWLEIDMGTERRSAITRKLAEYIYVYKHANRGAVEGQEILPVWPQVVFLAPDMPRVRELRAWIQAGPEEGHNLFIASTIPEFARLLFS